MDHVVCLDSKYRELENLLNGNKTMLIWAGSEKTPPYGSVSKGDILYFISHSGKGIVEARGYVSSVFNSDELSVEESFETIIRHQDRLQLPDKQFDKVAGKKYLVLIGLDEICAIPPFPVETINSFSIADSLPFGTIESLHIGKVRIA